MLVRVEGRQDECDQPTTAPGWHEADTILRGWARTAPVEGGHHKCDFTVEWADGEKYEGRFDLTYQHRETADLARQVRDFAGFMSGKKPAHMTTEQYAGIQARIKPEQKKGWTHLLRTYDMESPTPEEAPERRGPAPHLAFRFGQALSPAEPGTISLKQDSRFDHPTRKEISEALGLPVEPEDVTDYSVDYRVVATQLSPEGKQ